MAADTRLGVGTYAGYGMGSVATGIFTTLPGLLLLAFIRLGDPGLTSYLFASIALNRRYQLDEPTVHMQYAYQQGVEP